MASAQTVPLFLDSPRPAGDPRYARCTYFCVDCQTPQIDWLIDLSSRIPVILLGMNCVVTAPLRGELFISSHQIEELFNSIERTDGLIIEVNDLFVPRSLLPPGGETRGSVLRANIDFFILSFAFRSGQLSQEEFLSRSERISTPLRLSIEESTAFQTWEENVIIEAKRYYRENLEQALPWKGHDDDPGTTARNQPPPPKRPPPPDFKKFTFGPFDATIPRPRSRRQLEGLTMEEQI